MPIIDVPDVDCPDYVDCLLWMQEVRELEALAKKAEELGRDPILLAKEKNSGTGVAAAFK